MSAPLQKPLVTIDGQPITIATMKDAVRAAIGAASSGRGFSFFTLNLDHLVKRRTDKRLREAYERSSFVSADGAPIVALAQRRGVDLERTTGADLVDPLCAEAARMNVPVFFFGSSDETLWRAATTLKRRYPSLDIRGCEAPPQGFDPQSPEALAAGARIAASGAKLCFLALGAPKQEILADRLLALHGNIGFLCIGAALDFIAGTQVRAPRLFQRAGLEWFWRLAHDPMRLGARYWRCARLYAELLLEADPPLPARLAPAKGDQR